MYLQKISNSKFFSELFELLYLRMINKINDIFIMVSETCFEFSNSSFQNSSNQYYYYHQCLNLLIFQKRSTSPRTPLHAQLQLCREQLYSTGNKVSPSDGHVDQLPSKTFTKINTPPWLFFTFFKFYKCY